MSARGQDLWRATVRETVAGAPFEGRATADLIIIGGGYTGCSAALHAAEAGLSTLLFEAEQIGHGGSGRNVGLVNAGLWTPPEEIAATLGEGAGAKLTAALGGAPDLVFSLIERFGIDCDPVRAGTLHVAHAPRGLRDLRERVRQLRSLGAPATLLSAQETADRTGAVGFHGALHDARAGVIHPLGYCAGLARAAQTAGAALHERSAVHRIAHERGVWRVKTASGVADAPRLLLATNAYHHGAAGVAAPRSVPVHYFQLATRPLGHNLRRTVLPGGEGCWDTATVMSSFRLDGAGRLMIGAIGSLGHGGAGAHSAWARRKLAALFPALADEPFEHAWFGRIAMTSDHLPKVLRLGPGGYAIFGYSGRGIGPGTAFGAAAAECFAGAGESALPLQPQNAHAETFSAARAAYYELGAALTHAISARR